MTGKFFAISLGALIGLSPLAAMAQADSSAAPMQVAQADSATAHAAGGGSHRSHMRAKASAHKNHARASAEHMRAMRHSSGT